MLLPVALGTVYTFNYYLVPKFLLEKHYFRFLLYSTYLLIISLNLQMYAIMGAFVILANYNYANMNPVSTDVFLLTVTLYFIVLGFAFIRLVRFYLQNQNSIAEYQTELEKSLEKKIVVKENRKNVQISIQAINYIESLGDYVKIQWGEDKHTLTKEKISHLSNRLPEHFIRVHRSFLVNRSTISRFTNRVRAR